MIKKKCDSCCDRLWHETKSIQIKTNKPSEVEFIPFGAYFSSMFVSLYIICYFEKPVNIINLLQQHVLWHPRLSKTTQAPANGWYHHRFGQK